MNTSSQLLLVALRLLFPAQFPLQELLSEVVEVAREGGYHFSDVLKTLALYVREESSVDPDTQQTRLSVASLLELAAEVSETYGRELP